MPLKTAMRKVFVHSWNTATYHCVAGTETEGAPLHCIWPFNKETADIVELILFETTCKHIEQFQENATSLGRKIFKRPSTSCALGEWQNGYAIG
jgi:hypothetical protein